MAALLAAGFRHSCLLPRKLVPQNGFEPLYIRLSSEDITNYDTVAKLFRIQANTRRLF
jgi:hypothetical protein